MPFRRSVNLETERPKVGGGVQVGNFELDMKRPASVCKQAEATLAQAQEGEPAGQMEQHGCAGQPAIELKGSIDVSHVERESREGNGHWPSAYVLKGLAFLATARFADSLPAAACSV